MRHHGLTPPESLSLRRAIRADGVLLKPCFPILRAERYYVGPYKWQGDEVWTSVGGPAGSDDARTDARANSMASMSSASRQPDALWWPLILSTAPHLCEMSIERCVDDVAATPNRHIGPALKAHLHAHGATEQLLATSELWPAPPARVQYLVAKVDSHQAGEGDGAGGSSPSSLHQAADRCVHSAKASSCLTVWAAGVPLNVSALPSSCLIREPDFHVGNHSCLGLRKVQKSFVLYAAAPILSTGWTLLGDLTKLVPVSPQRFVARPPGEPAASAPRDKDLARWRQPQLQDLERTRDGDDDGPSRLEGGVAFTVLGAPGESVEVSLVAPPPDGSPRSGGLGRRPDPLDGQIVKLALEVGPGGTTNVECFRGGCMVQGTGYRTSAECLRGGCHDAGGAHTAQPEREETSSPQSPAKEGLESPTAAGIPMLAMGAKIAKLEAANEMLLARVAKLESARRVA